MSSTSNQKIEALENEVSEAQSSEARARAALERAQARIRHLEAVLETVPVGVIMADEKGQIFHGNSLAEEMVRHPVLPSPNVDSYDEWIAFHENGTQVKSREYPLSRVLSEDIDGCELDVHYQRGDGKRFWMRIIGRAIFDKTGNRIGASVALIDIDRERQLQHSQNVLIGELDHRVKNAFSVVKSIVSLSLGTLGVERSVQDIINRRLDAYAIAHAKLVGTQWDRSPIRDVISDIVDRTAQDRIVYDGPDIAIPSREALALSMAIYELSTNAIKYGALSVPEGGVTLHWSVDNDHAPSQFFVEWMEHGGPAAVVPLTTGFGSFIIDSAICMETSGAVTMTYGDEGFRWQLTAPVKDVT
ncbi:HWE histidine kinase domain-containing protein [Erythrobacter sp. R86502]|uniref:HWE histidine kinase domain-containing protein n=1 Tax=Erythrobacter sp. R86502 TaxID=3093846 RepID=UPI0036D310C9